MKNIYMTAREASIEGNRNRTVDISILVDEGQEAELLENFTARDIIRHFGEDELLREMDTDAIIDYLEDSIGISIKKEETK